MWKGLSIFTDSSSPIVVVLSGSMEPAMQRGDLLVLWNRNIWTETAVGDIVVYSVKGKDIPIVHRVVRKFGVGWVVWISYRGGIVGLTQYRPKAKLLTKGDNNHSDDTELYAKGQDFLERENILGYVLRSSYAVKC